MRRLLHPTVALVTFLIGVAAVAGWLAVNRLAAQTVQTQSLSTAAPAARPPLTQSEPETEKYGVYAALIRDMYLEGDVELAVIGEETGCVIPSDDADAEKMRGASEEYAFKAMPELSSETLEDFHYQIKHCRILSRNFELPLKYVLVNNKKLEALFPSGGLGDGWNRFYARYPHSTGIIGLSNVGFNREMNQALVYTSRSCGGLCGAGFYVLLAKEQGSWKVQRQVNTWVS
jgi:hypothetical protein